jgi:hypothetical protein
MPSSFFCQLSQFNIQEKLHKDILPGSIAADIRDCASRTLFMASSISLLEVSDFRLGETRPAAT